MTDKEARFVEEYCKDFNGAQAAIRAGYSKASAKQIAYELKQRPDIMDAIKTHREELTISAEDAIKRISDNARTRLNDFFVFKKEPKTPFVRKSLKSLIKELEAEIRLEEEYFDRVVMTSDEQDDHHAAQTKRKNQIIRYQIELKINPKAYRDVPGETRYEEVAHLDLVKLAKSNDVGTIKSISYNSKGMPQVEMYSATEALEMILKYYGKLVKKVDHSSEDGSMTPANNGLVIDPSTLTPEELSLLAALIRKNGNKPK